VFYRDFGYSNSRRRILSTYAMAHDGHCGIDDASAHTFAEYVVTVHDPRQSAGFIPLPYLLPQSPSTGEC